MWSLTGVHAFKVVYVHALYAIAYQIHSSVVGLLVALKTILACIRFLLGYANSASAFVLHFNIHLHQHLYNSRSCLDPDNIINQYSFNKSMAERKLIHNRVIRHAKCILCQKCQYNEMFR